MNCMAPTVYVETSVISYLVSRRSRDLVIAIVTPDALATRAFCI